jgi:hypothetical protein
MCHAGYSSSFIIHSYTHIHTHIHTHNTHTSQPGGERQALVPAELAFGEKGVCTDKGECLVPPNSNIKLDIILKRVAVSPI